VVDAAYTTGEVQTTRIEGRVSMSDVNAVSNGIDDPAQAAELALLVELEACWENLRTTGSRPANLQSTLRELHGKQKAYELFRTKLVSYNKRYAPAHIPELLLNTPARLAIWCRAMRDLYLRVEHDSRSRCPVHLLEKAHRRAEQLAGRTNEDTASRFCSPDTIRAAIQDLDSLSQWCDDHVKLALIK
jgi:hypothetical protein